MLTIFIQGKSLWSVGLAESWSQTYDTALPQPTTHTTGNWIHISYLESLWRSCIVTTTIAKKEHKVLN